MTRVLTQSRRDFEVSLSRKARAYHRRVVRDQKEFDEQREAERESVLRRIAEMDAKMYRHKPRFD